MKNYKLVIQYDGTKYNGWQKQGNTPNTIQERFESVLSRMCGKKTEIFASGRTDAGVHAKRQVANFRGETELAPDEIKDYLNRYLPEDILVKEVSEADERFHSRLNAKSKTYEYRISLTKPDVFIRKYVFVSEGKINLEAMEQGAQMLLGKHDFKGFSSLGKTKKSTERTINFLDISLENKMLTFRINGTGFLYNMVRIIAGTLLAIGRGEADPGCVNEIFETKNRGLAGPTLPASGLTLTDVFY